MEKQVYKAIAEVALALSKEGISKDQNCSFGKTSYKFRGIDDIYNALAPVMAKAELVMLPRVLSRTASERVAVKEYGGSKTESVTFYVSVEVEYDLVSAKDGSIHTIKTFGEALDTGDKATNKAMSAAYKYACFQAFCIPTEGDNDADATTHSNVQPQKPPAPKIKIVLPEGDFYALSPEQWLHMMEQAVNASTDPLMVEFNINVIKRIIETKPELKSRCELLLKTREAIIQNLSGV
jgi:hypothetical protein